MYHDSCIFQTSMSRRSDWKISARPWLPSWRFKKPKNAPASQKRWSERKVTCNHMQMYIVHNHVCKFVLSFPTKIVLFNPFFVSIAIVYYKILQTCYHVHIFFTTVAEMKAFSAEWIAWSWWHPRRRRLAPNFRPGAVARVGNRLYPWGHLATKLCLQLYCIKGKGSLSDLWCNDPARA